MLNNAGYVTRFISQLRSLTAIALACLTSSGCQSLVREERIEQISCLGRQIEVVSSSNVVAASYEGGRRTFKNRRFYLSVYDLKDQECPPLRPVQIADIGIGMGHLSFEPGVRVDFLMGAYNDRIIRVWSRYIHGRCLQDVALLGKGSSSPNWAIIKSWSFNDPTGKRSFVGSISGRYLVFVDPVRVLDAKDLSSASVEGIEALMSRAFSPPSAYPTDLIFSENLQYLKIWTNNPSYGAENIYQGFPKWFYLQGVPLARGEYGYYIERRTGLIFPCPNDAIILEKSAGPELVTWVDWRDRMREAETGTILSSGPIWFGNGQGRNWIWDVENHTPVAASEAISRCQGIPLLVHTQAGGEMIQVLDTCANLCNVRAAVTSNR